MTGSLQIKNGKYYAVLNYRDEYNKRKQKWICTELGIKGNKKAAEKFLHQCLEQYDGKESVLNNDMYFHTYITIWLESIKHTIEKSTFESYTMDVKNHILPYFEKHKFKMGEIKALHLQAYYGEMLEKGKKDGSGGLSPKTIKNHHTIIRKSLQDAMRNEMIPSNPADLVKLPKKQRFMGEFYTLSQANLLIESSKDTEFYVAVVLALYTGCRRSEILGFKWESVNWESGTITVKTGDGSVS